MNRTIATLVAILGSMMIALPTVSQETFTGEWVVTTHVPNVETEDLIWIVTEVDGEYVFRGEGGSEVMNTAFGIPTAVEISFDGTSFMVKTTFEPEGLEGEFVIENSGVIDGDTFEGTSKFGEFSEYRLTGVRR